MHVPILLEIQVVKTVVSDTREFIIACEYMHKKRYLFGYNENE
jgi:hypothetical protein